MHRSQQLSPIMNSLIPGFLSLFSWVIGPFIRAENRADHFCHFIFCGVYFLPLQQKSTHAFAQYAFQGSFATNSVSYVESQQHHTPVPKDGS